MLKVNGFMREKLWRLIFIGDYASEKGPSQTIDEINSVKPKNKQTHVHTHAASFNHRNNVKSFAWNHPNMRPKK